jgi:hypothetical protein
VNLVKAALLLIAFVLLGLIGAYAAVQWAGATCSSDDDSPNQTIKYFAEAYQPSGGTDQQNSTSTDLKTALDQPETGTNKQQTNSAADRVENDQSDWGHDFWCSATVTDYAIAYFTYCLVVVGAFSLWRSEYILRASERAHIFPDIRNGAVPIPGVQALIVPRNTGRSAGIIREIYGQYSLTEPRFNVRYIGGDLHRFDTIVEANSLAPVTAGFPSLLIGPQFFFGYVTYMDMFKKRHRSYFCCRVVPGGNLTFVVGAKRLNRFY